jgi:hypothetical protein
MLSLGIWLLLVSVLLGISGVRCKGKAYCEAAGDLFELARPRSTHALYLLVWKRI